MVEQEVLSARGPADLRHCWALSAGILAGLVGLCVGRDLWDVSFLGPFVGLLQ